jgi:hypothetical protein
MRIWSVLAIVWLVLFSACTEIVIVAPEDGSKWAEGANVDVIVEFSKDLDPFTNGTGPAEYVRVRVESFAIEVWLLQVMQLQGEDFTNESFRCRYYFHTPYFLIWSYF